ncbi:MAG: hypothetical protein E6G64_01940 [Actinobacteria bacterium]|nr:MAG: hypothetical protein E6G64_01940 [Actinomycetota bacterium]
MPFLPDKRFVIDADAAPDEVRARLQESVAPLRRFAIRRPSLPFAGRVDGESFELRPVLGYGSSFSPLVQGTYSSAVSGTRIDVRMRLLRPVAAFMTAWLSFAAVLVGVASIAAAKDPLRIGFVLLALAFFGVGYGCMAVLFGFETRRTRAKLEQLLA